MQVIPFLTNYSFVWSNILSVLRNDLSILYKHLFIWSDDSVFSPIINIFVESTHLSDGLSLCLIKKCVFSELFVFFCSNKSFVWLNISNKFHFQNINRNGEWFFWRTGECLDQEITFEVSEIGNQKNQKLRKYGFFLLYLNLNVLTQFWILSVFWNGIGCCRTALCRDIFILY